MDATKTSWRNTKLLVTVSFLITAILLLILFGILHMAPFGGNSLAQFDANIQYIDFFTYLRGILLEEKSASYTFTKGLGGNVWGVIAYYLLSPLNLLVVFFQQGELHTFYDLLVLLKLSLCSATMTFYLEKRFNRRIPAVFLVLLAISYGLMQYNLEQAKNIMWLDPLYMLPLLLLGTLSASVRQRIFTIGCVSRIGPVVQLVYGDDCDPVCWNVVSLGIYGLFTRKRDFSTFCFPV